MTDAFEKSESKRGEYIESRDIQPGSEEGEGVKKGEGDREGRGDVEGDGEGVGKPVCWWVG